MNNVRLEQSFSFQRESATKCLDRLSSLPSATSKKSRLESLLHVTECLQHETNVWLSRANRESSDKRNIGAGKTKLCQNL